MATYKEIQNYVRENNNITVETCWIADIKRKHGLTRRVANNRLNPDTVTNPCPERFVEIIENAFRHFGLI